MNIDRPDLRRASVVCIGKEPRLVPSSTAQPLAGNILSSPDFVIAEWQDPGGPPGPPRWIAPLHLHRTDDEAWYVLEGRLIVKVGDKDVEVPAGSAVLVLHGTPHTYWNPEPGPTRYLLIMTANIHALIQGIHALTERTPATLRAVFEKHNSELLG